MIDGETGLLVDEADAHAAAAAIQRILDDPMLARRLGEGGWKLARSRTWVAYAAEMLRTYRRILTRAGSRRRPALAARAGRPAGDRSAP